MDKQQLIIEFKDIEGDKFTLRLDDPKEDIDTMQVEDAALSIAEHGVFGEGLIPIGARMVTTSINEYKLD